MPSFRVKVTSNIFIGRETGARLKLVPDFPTYRLLRKLFFIREIRA